MYLYLLFSHLYLMCSLLCALIICTWCVYVIKYIRILIFTQMETMRPAKTEEEKDDEKERTIQVFDIALYVKEKDIHDAFEMEGDIEKIYTKQVGIYQQAYITYARKECTAKFYKVWSYHMKQDIVRVIPSCLTKRIVNS